MATDIPRHSSDDVLSTYGIKVCSIEDLYQQADALEAMNVYHRTGFYHIFRYKGEDNSHYIGYKKKIKFRNNSILVINQDTLHKFPIRKCTGDIILFDATFFGNTKEKIKFLNHCSLFQSDYVTVNSQNDYFRTCVEAYFSLMKIQIGRKLVTELSLLRNWLHNLLIMMEREYKSHRKRFEIPDKQNYMRELRQFKILLDMYYRTQKQVGFYAKRLNLSKKKLTEAVFAAYGLSIKGYINEKILTEAIRLLKNTTLTQGEIANELGYDFTYFVKFFRRHTGITPAKYRQKDEAFLQSVDSCL
jgi:AraC-like DNA-binding protein